MILSLVTWPAPPEPPADAAAMLAAAAPPYQAVAGLRRKWFIGDGAEVGGVYEWESREAAERWFGGPWRERMRARYGAVPVVRHFEIAALVDNVAGEVVFTARGGRSPA